MDAKIVKFIFAHHVLTLATVKEGMPHTSNIFYVFDKENYRFYFASQENTQHIQEGLINPNVGVSILLETKVIGRIRGLQALGILLRIENEELSNARKKYIKRFPYTALLDLHLWAVELNELKYTDNTLGFGKKIFWKRQ